MPSTISLRTLVVTLSQNIWRLDMIVFGNATRVQLDYISQYMTRLVNRHNPRVLSPNLGLRVINGQTIVTLRQDSIILSLKLIFDGPDLFVTAIRNSIMQNLCNDIRMDRPVIIQHCCDERMASALPSTSNALFMSLFTELPSVMQNVTRPIKRTFGHTRGDYVLIDHNTPGPSSRPDGNASHPDNIPLRYFKRGRLTDTDLNNVVSISSDEDEVTDQDLSDMPE